MAEEPDNIVLVMLRDIRSKQDEHSDRLDRVEKQLDRLTKAVTYSSVNPPKRGSDNHNRNRESTSFSTSWKSF